MTFGDNFENFEQLFLTFQSNPVDLVINFKQQKENLLFIHISQSLKFVYVRKFYSRSRSCSVCSSLLYFVFFVEKVVNFEVALNPGKHVNKKNSKSY